MKTLLFASALLLSAAGADGSPGGIPDGSDPNVNDATHAPPKPELTEDEISTLAAGGINATESDEDFQRRVEAERAEFEQIRKLTPVQELEVRPCPGASHLGIIIGTPAGIRCIALADWRTERINLLAGDHAQIVVLAGEGLKTWEFYKAQEARAGLPTLGGVRTEAIPAAVAAQLVGGLAAGAAPALDPLEQTQPAIDQAAKDADQADSISSGAGLHDTASDSAVAQGS